MCVEKTRAYVKDNKLKLINGIVGWGRPVYAGEENTPLLSKVGSSDLASKPAKSVSEKPAVATKPNAKTKTASAALKKGSKGPQVKEIQKALGLKVDGQFGPGTEKAVKDFQKSKSINPNGIVDANTLKAIKGK
jgi:peptidoglycan hydrolase-like protein with peptidoglycan-binding domain